MHNNKIKKKLVQEMNKNPMIEGERVKLQEL